MGRVEAIHPFDDRPKRRGGRNPESDGDPSPQETQSHRAPAWTSQKSTGLVKTSSEDMKKS